MAAVDKYAQRLTTSYFNECIRSTSSKTKKDALSKKLSEFAGMDLAHLIRAMTGALTTDRQFIAAIDQRTNAKFDSLFNKGATNTRKQLTLLLDTLRSLQNHNTGLSYHHYVLINFYFEDCVKETSSTSKKTALNDQRAQLLHCNNDEEAKTHLRDALRPGHPFSKAIDEKTGFGQLSGSASRTRNKMHELLTFMDHAPAPELHHWMSVYANQTLLRHMTLPGSHDAGVYDDPTDPANRPLVRKAGPKSWGICHSLSIYNQACAGVRYFDIRIDKYENSVWRASHDKWGFGTWGATADKILEDMMQFLDENPSEFLIYKVTHTGDKTYIETMMRRLRRYTLDRGVLTLSNHALLTNVKLGDVRGKIILLIEDDKRLRSWNLNDEPDFMRHHYFAFRPKKGDEPNEHIDMNDGLVVWGGNNGGSIAKMINGQLRKAAEHALHQRVQNLDNAFFQMSWTQMFGDIREKSVRTHGEASPHALLPLLIDFLLGNQQPAIDANPAFAAREGAASQEGFHSNPDTYPNFLHMDNSSAESSAHIIRLNHHLTLNQGDEEELPDLAGLFQTD